MNASPYKEDDLYRPADEGRSLHDDSRAYYQEVMKLKTPITIDNLPDLAAITKSFVDLPKNNNLHHQFLINLSATKQKDLWPNKNYIPKTKECIFIQCCEKYDK